MITPAEWQAEVEWRREYMPMRVTFMVGSDEAGLRAWIRGELGLDAVLLRTQSVILQGTAEMDRVVAAMSNLKLKRDKPYGGAIAKRELR